MIDRKKNAGIFVGNINKSTKFTATNSRGNSKNICKHDKGAFLNLYSLTEIYREALFNFFQYTS